MKRYQAHSIITLGLMFPAGIWLGLLGYEQLSLPLLMLGWVPVIVLILEFLEKREEERNEKKLQTDYRV